MIIDLIPKILVDLLTDNLKSALQNMYISSSAVITTEAENRIRYILGR